MPRGAPTEPVCCSWLSAMERGGVGILPELLRLQAVKRVHLLGLKPCRFLSNRTQPVRHCVPKSRAGREKLFAPLPSPTPLPARTTYAAAINCRTGGLTPAPRRL